MSNNLLDFKIPENYGKGILIIASDTFKSFLREKRFYISFAYYFILPIFLLFLQSGELVVQTGTGIAIYYAQLNTANFVKGLFLTLFPGQIFLAILCSDQIASGIENDTLSLILSKPTYHSEIVLGKFFGLVSILAILQIPSMSFVYYYNLIRYDAEFPFAFYTSFDEVLVMFILILLLQSIIIGLTLMISSIFDRSLYAILSSILSLFIISSISENQTNLEDGINYFNLGDYIDAILPVIFFNLNKLDPEPNIALLLFLILFLISLFLFFTNLILNRKELF